MPLAAVLAGLGCGMIVTGHGALTRADSRLMDGLSWVCRVLTRIAAALLLTAAIVDWSRADGSPSMAPRLLCVAAVVAPVWRRRAHATRTERTAQAAAAILLGSSATAGAWVSAQAGQSTMAASGRVLGTIGIVAVAVAAGLGIRYGSRALARAIAPGAADIRPPWAAYTVLSAAVGLSSLSSLWTLGGLGLNASARAGLHSAFLAWSAVWLFPRARRAAFACLTGGSAIWLLWVALSLF